MPAETKPQRTKMCMALAIKLGKLKPDPEFPETTKMAKEMTVEQLTDFCGSPSKEEKKGK